MAERDSDTFICESIAARSGAADRHDGSLEDDIAALRNAGWLAACLPSADGGAGWGSEPSGTQAVFDALRKLGRANLSTARLFEGHVNAVKLVQLYAGGGVRTRAFKAVRNGALLGVWGADDADHPASLEMREGTATLSGAKRFASGLGLVEQAVIAVKTEAGLRLLLVPTGDAARADTSGWRVGGMRATASGTFDLTGLTVPAANILGKPDDYLIEPHFEGGIWRYCAAHLGAAEALYEAMRGGLLERERAGDPHQQKRLVECAIAVETARMWILRAAKAVEAAGAKPEKAALSLLAREVTEHSCLLVMDRVESALGMSAYVEGTIVERTCRDLRLFLRQAAPDAKRARAAQALLSGSGKVEDL